MKKTLFAAIVGRPNVGKSTLLNFILGKKVSIVSNKPQTTRTRVTGILSRGDTQYVFLDTPGIHKPQDKLGSFMVKAANSAICDVDAVLWIVEAGDKIGAVEQSLINRFNGGDLPVILLINKTDTSNAAEIAETILRFSAACKFHAPAAHHAVIAEQNDGGYHGEKPQPSPFAARGQLGDGVKGVTAAAAANHALREEDGERQHQHGGYVDEDEGSTSVLAHQVGEAPDIAQADGTARHGPDDSQAAAEFFHRFHLYTLLLQR